MPGVSPTPENAIMQLPLFDGCDPWFTQELAVAATTESFLPGEVIRSEGAVSSSLMVLLQGSVEVISEGSVLGEVNEPGAYFGEAQLFGVRHRISETVVAKSFVDMQVLGRGIFSQILQRFPTERTILAQTAASWKLEQWGRRRYIAGDGKVKGLEHILRKDLRGRHRDSTAMDSTRSSCLGKRPSLADWQRQLVSGPLGRRLHTSTLESPSVQLAASGMFSVAPMDATTSSPSRPPRPAAKSSRTATTPTPRKPGADWRPSSPLGVLAPVSYPPLPESPLPPMRQQCQQPRSRNSTARPRRRPLLRNHLQEPCRGQMTASPSPHMIVAPLPPPLPLPLSAEQVAAAAQAGAGVARVDVLLAATTSTSAGTAAYASQGECSGTGSEWTASRRLEVILRGAFKNPRELVDSIEAGDSGDSGENAVTPLYEEDPANFANSARAKSSVAGRVTSLEQPEVQQARERMGFGFDEAGEVPSGRTSVPAVRGSRSAPPIAPFALDEGIDLELLEDRLTHHIRRALERNLRHEAAAVASAAASPSPRSRSGSHDASGGAFLREVSPAAARSPLFSPPCSARASPTPFEELNLSVQIRLCHSRCGSSSAVLSLQLDHSPECSEQFGCVCKPTPRNAEAKLLAHFGRHSHLRLTSSTPPVRVILESLSEEEVEETP
eukprot:TRINITY_DN4550_c0_g1_i1.p1 TRINITY_DN4550_c0_g1~~TRINITY_DN4550_c0_g1_i1.p1  ORF type:complete len:667 (-),score=146.34 TRINITY_DN4550_c0_g1_i1:145-2145(-)